MSRSLETDWGVETVNLLPAMTAALFGGRICPLSIPTEMPSSIDEKYSLCWSTSGLVGASMSTFFPSESTLAAASRATAVFPRPVGRMTRVFCLRHSAAISDW